jgi:hypothetical protein
LCGLISGLICVAVLFVPGVLDPERVPNLDTSLGTETRRAGVDETPDPS